MSMKYCTYLTTYLGNKLPLFYIGYSTIDNINNGYHGSVISVKYKEMWNKELNEHPELFKTVILTKHKIGKKAAQRERHFQIQLNVVKNPLYINEGVWPYFNPRGIPKTEEHKRKISIAQKGKKYPHHYTKSIEWKLWFSKNNPNNDPQVRLKKSIALKGRPKSLEHIQKMVATRNKNGYGGYTLKLGIHSGKNNPMFGKRHTEESKQKMRKPHHRSTEISRK